MKPKLLILSLIIIFSGIIRLFYLNTLPTGIKNDELHFVLNAKSIYYGFTNLEATANPFKLREFSSLIFAPIIGPLPTNLFTARLPYAIVGCLSIILIYLLTQKLTKNTSLALLSALVLSLNPWSIYVSRTSFDAPVAIFFYLLTLYLLTSSKPKVILLSILTGFIAFNAYIGTKVIFFPIIALSSYYLWNFFKRKNTLAYLITVLFSLGITINFLITLPKQSIDTRLNEIQSPNSQMIKDQVNLERRQSLQVPLIMNLFTNKYTVYSRNFIQKYLYNFSTDVLFLSGDHTATGSLWRQGYFYYLDAVLILLGIIYLYLNYPKFLTLIGTLILLSPIPEAVRSSTIPSYVFHSSLQYPFLCIVIAAGILFFWQKITSIFFRVILVSIYALCFINFVDLYFFKAPIYQPEAFSFSHRVLAKYLKMETEHSREIYVLTQEPEVTFRSYIFYTNFYTKDKYNLIKNIYSQSTDHIALNNIHFINHHQYLPPDNNFTLIYDTNNFTFDNKTTDFYISNLSDAGSIYTISRGLSCQNLVSSTYPNNIHLNDLHIEKIDNSDFCKKYLNIK